MPTVTVGAEELQCVPPPLALCTQTSPAPMPLPTNLCTPEMSVRVLASSERSPSPASETSAQQRQSCLQSLFLPHAMWQIHLSSLQVPQLFTPNYVPHPSPSCLNRGRTPLRASHIEYKMHMGCRSSIFCRNHLYLDHTTMLTPCHSSPRSSRVGLTRINKFGRETGWGGRKMAKWLPANHKRVG